MSARRYNNNHLTDPAWDLVAVTPGATVLPDPIRGFYVGVSGNVTVTTPAGSTVELIAVAAGVAHPVRATHVTAATATGIIGLI